MPSLLEKIETNAATRLALPPDCHPRSELGRYKDFLKVETHRLKILHRSGVGGREVCQARSAMMDILLRHLLQAIKKMIKHPRPPSAQLALVAIGGYGRGEMNPNSDIDLMFLHNGGMVSLGAAEPYMAELTEDFLCTLWDIGLKVGHSVRSVDDCVRVANEDMQSKTSLIEARCVAGDPSLFARLQANVLAKCVRNREEDYIAARIEDQEARRVKYGNSASMQEPNIKNGCGGLRDYQNLLWMAFFKYRVRSLEELEEREMISAAERKQLDAAYDFLLRARNELHYLVNRAVDVLPKAVQPSVAHGLGYTERSLRLRLEHFMGDLYGHMRNIDLITRTLEQRLALLPGPQRMPAIRDWFRTFKKGIVQQVDGFNQVGQTLHFSSRRVFREHPRRLIRVFLHAQKRDAKLHPDLIQLLRHELQLMNREFLRDTHVAETFLEILNQRGNVAGILRLMHEVGFLGKYLPEFGKLTCLVQHEFYHQYTADEHTLKCIEKLDLVWEAKEHPYAAYSSLFQHLERPFVLYLALLLHDAGKAVLTGRHSEEGGRIARAVAKRLGLDGATTHTLCLIIEHHLLMTQISQRRDLDDPAVIQAFAAQIQSRENLALLTLHTFADSMGTSDQLWNGFKDSLLWILFQKTNEALIGKTSCIRAEETQRQLLAHEVRRLVPAEMSEEEIGAHFENLPARYFLIHSPREIALHIQLAHRFMRFQLAEEERALEPVIHWQNVLDRGYTSVTVCTWDRVGLFSTIAGCLTAAGLNILSAQIHTRTEGIILDTFFVTDAPSGSFANPTEQANFDRWLAAALMGDLDLEELMAGRKPKPGKPKPFIAEPMPTQVQFDNATSAQYTIVEVETEDRLGLLYMISKTLAGLGVDIALAKICTEKGAAIDSFYIHLPDGGKILDPARLEEIAARITEAIHRLDSGPAA